MHTFLSYIIRNKRPHAEFYVDYVRKRRKKSSLFKSKQNVYRKEKIKIRLYVCQRRGLILLFFQTEYQVSLQEIILRWKLNKIGVFFFKSKTHVMLRISDSSYDALDLGCRSNAKAEEITNGYYCIYESRVY